MTLFLSTSAGLGVNTPGPPVAPAGAGGGAAGGTAPQTHSGRWPAAHAGSPSRHTRVSALIAPEVMRALSSSVVAGPVWAPFFM